MESNELNEIDIVRKIKKQQQDIQLKMWWQSRKTVPKNYYVIRMW